MATMNSISLRRIPVRTLASGHVLTIPVYQVRGRSSAAPKAYIQAGMHGAELQGHAAIAALLEHFRRERPLGDVILVPTANPVGLDQKQGEWTDGRFDPTTGDNWNRAYWMPVCSGEKERADPDQIALADLPPLGETAFRRLVLAAMKKRAKRELPFAKALALRLQTMAFGCDFVLDLHTANRSVRHLYSPNYALADATAFGIRHILSIPPVFTGAMDEAIFVPWSMFAGRFLRGSPSAQGFTLELGNQEEFSLAAGQKDAAGILRYLRHKGVVAGRAGPLPPALFCDLADYYTLHAPAGGLYDYVTTMGKPVRKGAVVARRVNFTAQGAETTEVLAPEDMIPILTYSSGGVHEGDELLKGFTRWRKRP